MKKWNMIIDVEKCENCNNCFLACKDEYIDNDFPGYSISQPKHGHRWMDIKSNERGQYPLVDVAYLPKPCMHCDDAPCTRKANAGAVYKRADGIVIIDPEKALGHKEIVSSCPYGAIWWNEDKQTPQKCTFCAHLLDDGWKTTRCAQVCPTGALRVVFAEDTELLKLIESEGLESLKPECQTRPRVHYKNLHRFLKCFIAGSVAYEKKGITDCAEGAKVALLKGSDTIDVITTDNFGDFKFDHIPENSGKYSVAIEYKDYDKKVIEIEINTSRNMGIILL